MAKTDFKSVGRYIAAQPEAVQRVLELIRSTIRKALPGAEEVISFQIPAYKLRGETVIYFAGWKQRYSLYPVTADLVEAFKDDLAPYALNDRGTLRFTLARASRLPIFRASLVQTSGARFALFTSVPGVGCFERRRSRAPGSTCRTHLAECALL